ncbi:hypothetical protein B0H12DRAFT_1093073 [Mycena haematopus]|nr:hypothetical protein B0H12DRAFT_1093073 [Mycena haematopus]
MLSALIEHKFPEPDRALALEVGFVTVIDLTYLLIHALSGLGAKRVRRHWKMTARVLHVHVAVFSDLTSPVSPHRLLRSMHL